MLNACIIPLRARGRPAAAPDPVPVILGDGGSDGWGGHVQQEIEHHSGKRERDARETHSRQLRRSQTPHQCCTSLPPSALYTPNTHSDPDLETVMLRCGSAKQVPQT